MSINMVIDTLQTFFYDVIGKEIQIISIVPNEDGWDAEFEAIVEDEYMRRIARKEIIARYEAKIDERLNIVSYQRKALRERGSLE
ncbi:MAG: gas vesicle protein GvpO [Bacillota bacterium]